MGSDSNPSSPQSSATPLKSKKSLDWLAKSFKRKGSTSSTSSNSSDHRRSGLVGNSRNIHNHEPLLTIPGSPAITQPLYSPATSSDDGDARSSRSDLGPFTPDEAIPGHLVLPQTRPIHSPLASPSILPASPVSPGSPPTMSLKAPQPLSPGRIGTLSPSKICEESRSISLSNVPSRSSTPGRDLQSQIDKDSPGREKEKLLTSVSSRKALRTMLDDPVGLWKLGQFLASEMNAETLVFWLNAEQHRNDLKRLYALTQKIHSLHIPSQAPMALNITSNERASIERAIRSFTKIDDPYKVARDAAFQALYHDAWPRFLQWRLQLLHNKSQRCNSQNQTSFTLADPSRDRDQPLLLVSDGFLDLTGYSRQDVLMRNCRFLQGPGTSPAVISRIRQASSDGSDITELLLNYRKDGLPFWSLLRIIPLRNATGRLKYLLGCQINVTSTLAATKDLANLLSDDLDPLDMPPRPLFEDDLVESQTVQTNEAMRAYLTSLDSKEADPLHKKSEIERRDIVGRNSSVVGSPATGYLDSPVMGRGNVPSPASRPRSANRDMHANAAAALFDGSAGMQTKSFQSPTANFGMSSAARPQTSASLFARPGTAYSMVDTEGKAQAQHSLAEQTQALNDSSSHYLILDSNVNAVLFHSSNLPAVIRIGADIAKIIGAKTAKRVKESILAGERTVIDAVSMDVPSDQDPTGIWRRGVQLSLTPLKDQINEVGAVVVLISTD